MLGVQVCPVLWSGLFNFNLEQLEKMAAGSVYPTSGKPIEGIVVRSSKEMQSKKDYRRISFKVVAPEF